MTKHDQSNDEDTEVVRLTLRRRATCGGRGYQLVPPDDPTNWDVDIVRVNCRGCPDCQPHDR